MANTLEFLLKLTDMLTPGMRQAAAITDSSAARIQRQLEQTAGSSRRMSASVDELRSRLDALNRVRFSTRIKSEFDSATREAQKLERQIYKLENIGRSGGLGMIGTLLGGVSVAMAAKGALGSAAEREQQRISFGVMTGSQTAGDSMLKDIVRMGAQTPFESGDLIKAAQTMKQFGIENKNVLPNLRMLGDVAGGNAEKLQSLSLAFSQVQSTGRLQGQDLLQLINSGFNPLLIISQQTGKSMAQLKKDMEAGAISADMVTKAFQVATGPGGQFYQMMEKQSQTLAGRWSTFMDNAKAKLLAFGEAIMPVASVVLSFLTGILENTPALIMLASGIGLVAAATGGWSAAQAVLNFVMNMNPIVRIISLILILGGIIWGIMGRYEGWGKSMQGLWEIIKGFVHLNLIAWKDLGESIWYWIQYAWLKVKGFVEWIGGAMGNVMKAIKLATEFKFGEAAAALTAEIKTNASVQLAQLEKEHAAGKLNNTNASLAAMKQMQDGWNMIGIKKKAGGSGVTPLTANGAAAGGSISGADFKGLGDGTAKSKADSVNAGGQRSIVINIGKQIEKLEVRVMNAQEGAQEIESAVRDAIRRVVYSLNGVVS